MRKRSLARRLPSVTPHCATLSQSRPDKKVLTAPLRACIRPFRCCIAIQWQGTAQGSRIAPSPLIRSSSLGSTEAHSSLRNPNLRRISALESPPSAW